MTPHSWQLKPEYPPNKHKNSYLCTRCQTIIYGYGSADDIIFDYIQYVDPPWQYLDCDLAIVEQVSLS